MIIYNDKEKQKKITINKSISIISLNFFLRISVFYTKLSYR